MFVVLSCYLLCSIIVLEALVIATVWCSSLCICYGSTREALVILAKQGLGIFRWQRGVYMSPGNIEYTAGEGAQKEKEFCFTMLLYVV